MKTNTQIIKNPTDKEITNVIQIRRAQREQNRLDAVKSKLAGKMMKERSDGKMYVFTLTDGAKFKGKLLRTFYTLTADLTYKIQLSELARSTFVKVCNVADMEEV